jgi:hypothetical protein
MNYAKIDFDMFFCKTISNQLLFKINNKKTACSSSVVFFLSTDDNIIFIKSKACKINSFDDFLWPLLRRISDEDLTEPDEETNPLETYEIKWIEKIRKKTF